MGPMFCGKSSELQRRVRRYRIAKRRTHIVKFSGDTRYELTASGTRMCVTHDNGTYECLAASALSEIDKVVMKTLDVIGVDEGQFFPDLAEYCELWANAGKVVIVAALDGTWKRKSFTGNQICSLIPLCETVVKLQSVCEHCQSEAGAFSARKKSAGTDERVIGGKDIYFALCRSCHRKYYKDDD